MPDNLSQGVRIKRREAVRLMRGMRARKYKSEEDCKGQYRPHDSLGRTKHDRSE